MTIMVKLRIKEVAEGVGITTAYQLQKAANIPPSAAANWFNNRIKSISLESINLLCKTLRCNPADLFEYAGD